MQRLLNRSRLWWLSLTAAGSLFVLEGCDPTVRDTVLGGVESSATTLFTAIIQAFFESLAADDEGAATTVRAILDQIPQWFA